MSSLSLIIERWQGRGYLHVAHALLGEALLITLVMFAGLLTLETLLPTYIMARLSLTKFFFVWLVGSGLWFILGEKLGLAFTTSSPWPRIVSLGVLLWGIGLLLISLYKFPWWSLLILFPASVAVIMLFWKYFFASASSDAKGQ